jgi:Family of unknown function (DUF6263)
MRRIGRILLCVGLAASFSACKRTRREPAPVEKEVATTPIVVPPKIESAPVEIKITDPGKAPRRPLRFALTPGQKETGTIVVAVNVQVKEGEEVKPPQRMPVMKIGLELEVKDVTPEGDARYDFTFATVDMDDSANVGMGIYMEQNIKALIGVGGTTVINTRGVTKGLELRMPDEIDEQSRQLIDSIKQSAAHLSPPLPVEEVGVGATWIETATLVADGMKVTKTTHYKLVSLDDKRATMEITAQHVGDAASYAPQVPPGAKVELKEYQGTASGEVTVDFARVLAPSKQKATTVVEVSVSMADKHRNVRTTTTQEMSLSDVKVTEAPKTEAKPATDQAPTGQPAK